MKERINKPKLNLSIDIIMFIVLMAVAGIGFLIKYVLVPGFKRNEIYGKSIELYFLGLDRHQWGNIHLILSVILLFILVLHIIFHWKQIVCVFRKMFITKFGRIAFVVSLAAISITLGIMPLFVNPEINSNCISHNEPLNNKDRHNSIQPTLIVQPEKDISSKTASTNKQEHIKGNANKHSEQNLKHKKKSEIEIYGYMTLNEVAKQYNIPAANLASVIHVPIDQANQKLGRLKKQYNFNLNDLRTAVENHNKQL